MATANSETCGDCGKELSDEERGQSRCELCSQYPSAVVMPCPFCGQSDIDLEGWKNNKGDTGPQCKNCGATCESVSMWNNRVNHPKHDRRAINESFWKWCLEKGQWP